jgi:hypothetical protein
MNSTAVSRTAQKVRPVRMACAALAGALVLFAGGGAGDPPAGPTPTNPLPARLNRPISSPPPTPPTTPPSPLNPVQIFRQLVNATPAAREQSLKSRSETQQRYLRERLADFDALPAAEREARLQLLEFRYYLLPLLRALPSERAALLARVPAADRSLFEDRLRAWDTLPAEQRQDLLANEGALSHFAEFQSKLPADRPGLTPTQRAQFQADLERWQALPEDRRDQIARHFSQFFGLTDRQKRKTLDKLGDAERARMETALAAFEKLPPAERARCVEALNRFAAMSPTERARFVRNAERWQALSPEERRAWRGIANRQPLPPPPPPPMPPGRAAAANAQAAATNVEPPGRR